MTVRPPFSAEGRIFNMRTLHEKEHWETPLRLWSRNLSWYILFHKGVNIEASLYLDFPRITHPKLRPVPLLINASWRPDWHHLLNQFDIGSVSILYAFFFFFPLQLWPRVPIRCQTGWWTSYPNYNKPTFTKDNEEHWKMCLKYNNMPELTG